MEKIIKACSLIAFFCTLTIAAVYANDGEKRKTYTKTYSLKSNQKVKISNKFGKVEVNSWNRNEVKVDVTIIASSKDDQTAQAILDNISIESSDGNTITFSTKFSNGNIKSKNSKMEVNYVVYMPSENALDLKNEFGNTFLPDWEGDINVNQSFGSVTTGKLHNAKDIDVAFGAITAAAINNGHIKVSYSRIKVDNLSGEINSKIDFCKDSKLSLPQTLKKLDMKISYSDVLIDISENIDATYKINTSFGNLKNTSKANIVNTTKESKYGPTFDKVYSGVNGSGKIAITINSSFGNVTIR